ncbi:hypothetical protein [Methylobacterium sp. CM6246]
MPEPMSLLAAAKAVAEIAELPWTQVLAYYRALQEPTGDGTVAWLPKSVGRSVWMAHPHFITPLLIALATAGHPERSNQAVDWVYRLTPNGRPRNLDELPAAGIEAPVLREFVRYLTDPAEARKLSFIRFEPSDLRVQFVPSKGEPATYRFHVSLDKAPGNMRPRVPGISPDGRIAAYVMAQIAQTIVWRTPDRAPFQTSADAEAL